MAELPVPAGAAASLDPAKELTLCKRKLTPKQRKVLARLPERGQFWALLREMGLSQRTGWTWMRDENFKRCRELLEQRALDQLDVTHAYVIGKTKDVVERSMQEQPVIDRDGQPVGVYEFDGNVALRGLEMLGKWRKTWADEANSQAPIGPGLTVIVQTAGGSAGVQAGPGVQGSVVVNLPGPER